MPRIILPPAWRASLIIAATATFLAVLYPIKRNQPMTIRGAYAALTPAAVLGPEYHDIAPILNRLIPLPPGAWHMVTAINSKKNGVLIFSRMILARLDGDRLTGLIGVQGTMAPLNVNRVVNLYRCIMPHNWSGTIIQVHGSVQQECWSIRPRLLPAAWAGPTAPPIYRHGLQRLREGGVKIPPVVMELDWFQKDTADAILVDYYFVPKLPVAPSAWQHADFAEPAMLAYVAGVKAWSETWTSLLERGVTRQLQPADVEQVSAKHPE